MNIPLIPSHHTDAETTARSMTTRNPMMATTRVALMSSRPRLMRRRFTVMRNTAASNRMVSSSTVPLSPGPGVRSATRAKRLAAATLAHPPQMKAKNTSSSENGTHSHAPGGTRANPTTGTSPVAIT